MTYYYSWHQTLHFKMDLYFIGKLLQVSLWRTEVSIWWSVVYCTIVCSTLLLVAVSRVMYNGNVAMYYVTLLIIWIGMFLFTYLLNRMDARVYDLLWIHNSMVFYSWLFVVIYCSFLIVLITVLHVFRSACEIPDAVWVSLD